jgi:lipoyl-dependent peroxiredoxin
LRRRGSGSFPVVGKVLYTTAAKVTGGRIAGHAVTDDGQLDIQIRIPSELGGDGGGTNPEQLFAAGYAACFESALGVVAQRMKLEATDAEIESKVEMKSNDDRGFDLGVELDVTLPSIDDAEKAIEVVEAAHKVCPYSNATRGNIDVKLTANGQPVGSG